MGDALFAPVAGIDRTLDRLLPRATEVPRRLHQAMRYSVFAGGKRLRPLLVVHACRACGGSAAAALPAAAAFEMVHVYSLIHDDLPAMDDDDLRRGRPTLHRRFDEATAILAGDALLTLAFETVSRLPPRAAPAVALELARASGTAGMIGGQVLDIEGEGKPATRAGVAAIHRRKTAALIAGAVRSGAIVAGAPPSRVEALGRYGRALGLAFQVVDDILDETGDAAVVGKPVRRDLANGKATYPRAVGIARARREVERLSREALGALRGLDRRAEPLRRLVGILEKRDR